MIIEEVSVTLSEAGHTPERITAALSYLEAEFAKVNDRPGQFLEVSLNKDVLRHMLEFIIDNNGQQPNLADILYASAVRVLEEIRAKKDEESRRELVVRVFPRLIHLNGFIGYKADVRRVIRDICNEGARISEPMTEKEMVTQIEEEILERNWVVALAQFIGLEGITHKNALEERCGLEEEIETVENDAAIPLEELLEVFHAATPLIHSDDAADKRKLENIQPEQIVPLLRKILRFEERHFSNDEPDSANFRGYIDLLRGCVLFLKMARTRNADNHSLVEDIERLLVDINRMMDDAKEAERLGRQMQRPRPIELRVLKTIAPGRARNPRVAN